MRNILIADDNPHAQRMGTQILGQAGHKVFTLSNGNQVRSFIAEHRPDVAILDLRMPGVSGAELCRAIKSDAELKSTKILLLAGPLDQINTAEVEGAGSDGVIQKPLDAHTLLLTIDGLFDAPSGDGENAEASPPKDGSLVDPPAPDSRRVAAKGATPKVASAVGAPARDSYPHSNGRAEPALASMSEPGLPERADTPQTPGPARTARGPAPRELDVASDEVMEEISDVVLGAMAPALPKRQTRDEPYRSAAARTNGSNGHNGKSLDPFAALVEHALGNNRRDEEFEARVLQIVDDVLQGAVLTIRERITHEIIASYRKTAV